MTTEEKAGIALLLLWLLRGKKAEAAPAPTPSLPAPPSPNLPAPPSPVLSPVVPIPLPNPAPPVNPVPKPDRIVIVPEETKAPTIPPPVATVRPNVVATPLPVPPADLEENRRRTRQIVADTRAKVLEAARTMYPARPAAPPPAVEEEKPKNEPIPPARQTAPVTANVPEVPKAAPPVFTDGPQLDPGVPGTFKTPRPQFRPPATLPILPGKKDPIQEFFAPIAPTAPKPPVIGFPKSSPLMPQTLELSGTLIRTFQPIGGVN